MIIFKEFTGDDKDALVSFLTGERWDFHGMPEISADKVREQLNNSYYQSSDVKTFWITEDNNRKIGFIRLFDLGKDPGSYETPLFDVRITEPMRGKGIGKQAVNWLAKYVFTNYPSKHRLEAATRIDNTAMRKVLESCGFVKEAHYRQAWPDEKGNKLDCAGYAILRSDWENHTTTPVRFTD